MDILTSLQPFLGPIIGGGLALLGGFIQGKRTEKATRETERRKLSHDSAREITAQLATLSGVARKHRDHNSLDLTEQGQAELWDCCSAMAQHARYISDNGLQDAVVEAVSFLRPPPYFEEVLGKSVPGVVYDLEGWLGPMVQAHIMSQTMPQRPDFLADYRNAYADAEEMWASQIETQEAYYAEEREKARRARE
ncbi:hypothetical protein [Pseudarthrobacter sp. NBSH8]|uniref:hypothetical protein n=1 Tax=Pseudarthrobacter sp. NBSH8 TaxID=2596911 RepID=UPI001628A426|nr:hypothetical protein [Pseudarthrobacter sp. NBSH8]QNE14862.1 hypothetical protein FYJ92_10785 [Pseudarthrobacter sp. NBSH8]